tara:strand:- start:243 stop:665 length:423 start_codon:yes stop_codon:yes gene_type:complete
MIKYNLTCKNGHEFISWFSNSSEFDNLKVKRLLECIYCSSKKIEKSIMSPMVSGGKIKENNEKNLKGRFLKEKNELLKIRNYIEKNFEFVGNDLSKKVREVYYDKKTNKKIYGTATAEEREELAEEGIDLISIPWVSKDN